MITVRFSKNKELYYKNFYTEKEINEFLSKELNILCAWKL
jgi:hypothetical protein